MRSGRSRKLTAWLVKADGMWLTAVSSAGLGFTDERMEALHFARQKDAQDFIKAFANHQGYPVEVILE